MLAFTIPLKPVTKKNHSQIIIHPKTKKPMLLPSKQFLQYQKDAGWYLNGKKAPAGILNVKALYFMPTHGKVDLPNLHAALHDMLVKYEVILDDNSKIIAGTDGSRVLYDKDNPRTYVEITTF